MNAQIEGCSATLLEVLANWMLFLAAAAMAAWFLLRT